MRIERTIISNLPAGEVRQKAARHLIAQRYRLINDGVEMKFERGTVFRSIFSFTARDSVVQAYLRPKQVGENTEMSVVFIATTDGRSVPSSQQSVWEEELNQLETAVTGISKPKATTTVTEISVKDNDPEYSGAEHSTTEYSDAAPNRLSAPLPEEVQSQVALIFATLLTLLGVSTGWIVGHSLLSVAVGLIFGVGAGFVLTGVWMSRFESDHVKDGEPKVLCKNNEGAKPQ